MSGLRLPLRGRFSVSGHAEVPPWAERGREVSCIVRVAASANASLARMVKSACSFPGPKAALLILLTEYRHALYDVVTGPAANAETVTQA